MHFPRGSRSPCQSQASAPQILQNTDINRLITRARARMALGVDIYTYIYNTGSRRLARCRGVAQREDARKGCTGKGKRTGAGSAGNLATCQACTRRRRRLQSALALARAFIRCHSRCIASLGRPNVSDDVADIANCKNYHGGNIARSSARDTRTPGFLTRR